MSGFAGVLLALDRPQPSLRPDLALSISAGDSTWGDGEEQVFLRHLGGDPLPRERIRIVMQIDGAHDIHQGSALDDGFADGRLSIGERWVWTGQIPADVVVTLDVIDVEARHVITTQVVTRTPGGGP